MTIPLLPCLALSISASSHRLVKAQRCSLKAPILSTTALAVIKVEQSA